MLNKRTKEKLKKLNEYSGIISIISIIITFSLGIVVYLQNEKINTLGRGQLANEILISSPQIDTVNKISEKLNISLEVTSNYEGAIPVYVKLVEVKLNKETILSGFKHEWTTTQEKIIEKDGKAIFTSIFEASKTGEYELNYIFYYNYQQKEGYTTGKSKPYTLKFLMEK